MKSCATSYLAQLDDRSCQVSTLSPAIIASRGSSLVEVVYVSNGSSALWRSGSFARGAAITSADLLDFFSNESRCCYCFFFSCSRRCFVIRWRTIVEDQVWIKSWSFIAVYSRSLLCSFRLFVCRFDALFSCLLDVFLLFVKVFLLFVRYFARLFTLYFIWLFGCLLASLGSCDEVTPIDTLFLSLEDANQDTWAALACLLLYDGEKRLTFCMVENPRECP